MAPERENKIKVFALALVTAAVAFAIHSASLRNGFVYDDLVIVAHNPNISRPSNIPGLFTKSYYHISGERTYRPLNTLSYMLDSFAWRKNPEGFHFTNVIIHSLNCAILFCLFVTLSGSMAAAFFGALLFAVHPLNTEAIAPVTFREDMLALTFSALGLLAYSLYRKKCSAAEKSRAGTMRAAAAVSACIVAGLACKESAISLLPILVIYEIVIANNEKPSTRMRNALPVITAASISAAAFLMVYFYLNKTAGGPPGLAPSSSETSTTVIMIDALSRYLKLAFYPASLCADYIAGSASQTRPILFANALFLIAPLFVAAASIKHLKTMSFGILFFFAALLPVSNIVPFGAVFAERYAYMPMAGMCLACSCLFLEREASAQEPHIGPPVFYMLLLSALVVAFGMQSRGREGVWKSELSLWSNTVDCCGESSRAHTNMGRAMMQAGNTAEALPYLEKAVELNPDNYEAQNALGSAYFHIGMYYDAIRAYNIAAKIKPEAKYTYYNLALVYLKIENMRKAQKLIEKSLKLDPGYADASFALVNILIKNRNYADAETILKKFEYKTKYRKKYLWALTVVYSETSRLPLTEPLLRELCGMLKMSDPVRISAGLMLGKVLLNTGRYKETEEEMNRILAVKHNCATAKAVIAIAYIKTGRKEEAFRILKGLAGKLQDGDPMKPLVEENLKRITSQ